MRLLLWYWGRRGAGAQLTLALAEALARRSEVAVTLSLSAYNELLPRFRSLGLALDAVPTYRSAAGFAYGLSRLPALAQRLCRQAQAFAAEAVVSVMTHLWTPLVAPALARAGHRFVPMIHDATPHPGDLAALWEWRLGRELAAAERVIAFSDTVAAAIARWRPDLAIHRLTLGALLPPLPLRAGPKAGDRVQFVHLGRMRAYKGLDLLRDAWRLLHPRHPEARLLVAGEGKIEALAPGLAALPGVTVQARWLSEDEMTALIASADAVVLPYREASQSGVAPVALGLGVPVIATPVGGLVEQIRHGVDGLVAEALHPAALAAAMATLCHPSWRATLTKGAQESARALRDWDACAARLLAILRA